MWNKITIKLILCYNLYVFCYFIYSKLSCNFIEIRLWGKCSPVNFLHIFGTPFPKYTTGGLCVGGMVSMSTFFTWMHVCFISFGQINTVFGQCVFYFNLFSWNINVIKCPKCPSTSPFVWRHRDAWNFVQPIFNTIGFQWCKYIPCDDYWIKKYGQPWIKNRVALLFFLESKQIE